MNTKHNQSYMNDKFTHNKFQSNLVQFLVFLSIRLSNALSPTNINPKLVTVCKTCVFKYEETDVVVDP